MTEYSYNKSDLTTFFMPYSSGTKIVTNYKINGNDIGNLFQPYVSGNFAPQTYFKNAQGADLNTLFQNINVPLITTTGSFITLTNSLYTVYKFINNGTIAFSTNQNINYCIVVGVC